MYQICVSGAAKGESVDEGKELAAQLGRAIAEGGHALMTGATVGLPDYAAQAYKAAGGKMSVGISPAASKLEHISKYRLPTEAYDVILYTGLHYVGRDMLLITSSDAVASVGGRLGTLHEFTIAFEADVPIGLLEGSGGISDQIDELLEIARPLRPGALITTDVSPAGLIKKLTDHLNREHSDHRHIYK